VTLAAALLVVLTAVTPAEARQGCDFNAAIKSASEARKAFGKAASDAVDVYVNDGAALLERARKGEAGSREEVINELNAQAAVVRDKIKGDFRPVHDEVEGLNSQLRNALHRDGCRRRARRGLDRTREIHHDLHGRQKGELDTLYSFRAAYVDQASKL
jgi:hypothetical protein